MFTKNIKDSFTKNLLNAVSGVLGEAKKTKCDEGCKCESCEKEEASEGFIPTNDMPDAHSRKVAGKLGQMLKREREGKEKKETNGVKTEEVEIDESRFSRIWAGDYTAKSEKSQFGGHRPHVVDKNGKTMYLSQHSYKNPETAKKHAETYLNAYASVGPRHAENATIDFARINKKHLHVNESIDPDLESELKATRVSAENKAKWHVTRHGKVLSTHTSKDVADVKAMKHPSNKVRMAEEIDEAFEQIDEISKATMGRYINKAKDQVDAASWRSGYRAAKPNDPNSQAIINAKEKQLSKRHGGIELAVKKLTKEEAEQIDENDVARIDRLTKWDNKVDSVKKQIKPLEMQMKTAHGNGDMASVGKLHKKIRALYAIIEQAELNETEAKKELTNEAFEQIDELSTDTLKSYVKKAIPDRDKNFARYNKGVKGHFDDTTVSKTTAKAGRKSVNRDNGIWRAEKQLTKEEQEFIDSINDADIEQIDELSDATLKSYAKKAMDQATSAHGYQKDAEKSGDHDRARREMKHKWKRQVGARNAIDRLGNNTLANEEAEQIDEISREALGSYVVNAARDSKKHGIVAGLKIKSGEDSSKEFKKMKNRENGIDTAVSRLTKEEQDFIDALNADTLDEARGRPRKAAAKDFTINPNTKEKLMHNNPEHMAKIEKLQKHGVLQKPKTEAGQNIMTQLQKAKTSMTGGTMVHFTHGDSKEVSGTHAAKLLDKHAGMKPNEKEAFQKKIGHSHENLKSEL